MCLCKHFVDGMKNRVGLLQLFLIYAGNDDKYFRLSKSENLPSLAFRNVKASAENLAFKKNFKTLSVFPRLSRKRWKVFRTSQAQKLIIVCFLKSKSLGNSLRNHDENKRKA